MLDNETRLRYLIAMGIPVWRLRSDSISVSTSDSISEPISETTVLGKASNPDSAERRKSSPLNAPLPVSSSVAPQSPSPSPSRMATPSQGVSRGLPEASYPTSETGWLDWIVASSLADPIGDRVPEGAARSSAAGTCGPADAELLVIDLPRHAVDDQSESEPGYSKPASRMLHAMLQAIGLTPVMCRFGCIDRSPESDTSLDEVIRKDAPKIVLVFTHPGISSELDNMLVSNALYASPAQSRSAEGTADRTRWIVSYHPTHLLEHPDKKRLVWEDLKLVQSILASS